MTEQGQSYKRWTSQEILTLLGAVEKCQDISGRIQWKQVTEDLNVTINQAKRQYNNIKHRHPEIIEQQKSMVETESCDLLRQSSLSKSLTRSKKQLEEWTPKHEETFKLCISNFGGDVAAISQYFPEQPRHTIEEKIVEYNHKPQLQFTDNCQDEQSEELDFDVLDLGM
ncbi:hypothetical protein SS50377_21182 [Spironucleus salmonicida]|uniref:Uncharacterized protein n=1 Tax=Spironucleus salmonicida TaxID=348837 RepID=V6LT41_9EUKA|nr:hypothetical protein SS50377_21182 [Spironucleus salmonicida]|eukprot:EST43959.1 Hypothetical protein SS50377_16265 [Spironucleus salmonicida]